MATNDKKMFLYVGYLPSGEKYLPYSASDLEVADTVDEFVLTCGNYDGYLADSSLMNEYVNDIFNLAKTVIETTGKFVWLGLPRPLQLEQTITIAEYTGYANKYINEFITPIQNKLKSLIADNGYDYYYNYVQGFYMNDEHVRRHKYTYFNPKEPVYDDPYGVDTDTSNLLAHPQIKMYSLISDKLKTSEFGWKKLLWAPYAGVGANYDTTFIDIAYIANTTNIFDTVLLQPVVYEGYDPNKADTASILKNLDVIRNSMNMQEVRTRDAAGNTNNRVVAKNSSTKIGCQMEVDYKYLTETSQNHQNYILTKNALSGNNVTVPSDRHFSFYCDCMNTDPQKWQKLVKDVVNPFFETL